MATNNSINSENRMVFIEEKTLSGATSTTFSGLSGVKRYILFYELDNATASIMQVSIRFNGDSVETDYAHQTLNAIATAVTGSRSLNSSNMATATANDQCSGYSQIKLTSNGGGSFFALVFAFNHRFDGSDAPVLQNRCINKNTAISSITQIELVSSISSAMNGKIALYEITT